MVSGSPGTPASSTTKTGRHDIAEILLKVALNTINQIKLNQRFFYCILELFRQCCIFFSYYDRMFTKSIYVSVIYQNDMFIFITYLKYIHFMSYFFIDEVNDGVQYNAATKYKYVTQTYHRICN